MKAKRSPGIQDDPGHPDYPLLYEIEHAIAAKLGGYEKIGDFMAKMLRKVIDDVIDTAETGRRTVTELEKTEKTYIGTKVEIVIRHALGVPKGKILDMNLDGHEVDVKFTIGGRSGNWMIPPEAVGQVLLLVAASEQENLFWLGLIVADESKLSASKNRDVKKTISRVGFDQIFWILNGHAYEPNFWAGVPQHIADAAFDKSVSGTVRVARLFKEMLRTPIPRRVVEEVAQQLDFTRRVRGNGGARDIIGKDTVILSPFMGSDAIRNLDLPHVSSDSWIAVDIRDARERQIIEQSSQTRNQRAWAARRPKARGPIERIALRQNEVPLRYTDDVDPDFDAASLRVDR